MLNIQTLLDDAFSVNVLTASLRDIPYQPRFLESLGIFQDVPINTDVVKIERAGDTLKLVPTTPRGAPVPQRTPGARTIRAFQTVRVANGDRINASELFGVRAYGTDSELETLASELLRRLNLLRGDNNLTQEFQRLGAIQGIVVDADGTTEIVDWFDEWDITPNAEIGFNLTVDGAGTIRQKLTGIKRGMIRNSGGTWGPGVQVYALAGDTFYDDLIKNPEVRQTYLNQQEAAQLRTAVEPFESFDYGGVRFFNYQGTDDGTTVGIDPVKAKFFPRRPAWSVPARAVAWRTFVRPRHARSSAVRVSDSGHGPRTVR
jgi:hypothetical protein